MSKIVIYTDGACKNNPGPGGYGLVILADGKRKEISGSHPGTTNNRMEMMAAIRALELLKPSSEVELITDSSYLKNGITQWIHGWIRKGWKTSSGAEVKNVDLWKRLHEVNQTHRVTWKWVKGHAGNVENERCDFLAVAGSNRASKGSEDELDGRSLSGPAPANPRVAAAPATDRGQAAQFLNACRPGRNLELKLRLQDPAELRRKALALGASPPRRLEQQDVFFNVGTGRLKLRFEKNHGLRRGELIQYDRSNEAVARLSTYARLTQPDPEGCRTLLKAALGEIGVVEKIRDVYLLGRTRLHVDVVKGLGDFAELELVLRAEESPESAQSEIKVLLKKLGLERAEVLSHAYLHLLLEQVQQH